MEEIKKVSPDRVESQNTELKVYETVHPWVILQEYINWLWISQRKFASLIFKKSVEVNYIIKWHRDITPDMAIRFAIIFDTRPDFRLWLQMDYDIYITYEKNIEKYQKIKNLSEK